MTRPAHRGDRLRAMALPLLLVAIASLGVHRSRSLDQSSWQGASFGMFATYDNRSSRTVTVTVTDADGERRVSLPDQLLDDAERLKVVPTDRAASRLAHAALDLARDDRVTGIEVEVRRISLSENGALQLRVERIAHGAAAR